MRTIIFGMLFSMAALCGFGQTIVPDSSFGNNGLVKFNFANLQKVTGTQLIRQPDKKIIAGGLIPMTPESGTGPTTTYFKISRVNENGSTDASFGNGGTASIELGPTVYISPVLSRRIALQADGKIVGTASIYNTSSGKDDLLIFRLKADGTRDSSFGTNGLMRYVMGYTSNGRCVTIQKDGKILVGGTYKNPSDLYKYVVIRLLPSGAPDNSFDGDGIRQFSIGSAEEAPVNIVEQTDGKLLVSGSSLNGANYDMVVVRLNTNGSFDTGFNGTGFKFFDIIGNDDSVGDMELQSDGKIVIGGWVTNLPSANSVWAIARLNANGTPDNSFSDDGKDTIRFGTAVPNYGYSLEIQRDGKIILGGEINYNNIGRRAALCRYNTNGRADSTFNVNGRKVFSEVQDFVVCQDLLLLENGKLLLGGSDGNKLTLLQTTAVNQGPDCNAVTIQAGNQQIIVKGLSQPPIATVQVFNSSWASVYQQNYTSAPDSINIPSLPAGQYFVKVNFYTSAWVPICEKGETVSVTGGVGGGGDTYDCNAISITPANGGIQFTGLTAPVITIHVFNSNWVTAYNQTITNSPGNYSISSLAPGTYHVKVSFYTSGWSPLCEKNADVTIAPANPCPPGAICISNTCPQQTVDLNTAYSIPNLPQGTMITWHTATPATAANQLTAAQAQSISASGNYYAAIHIAGSECYSQTILVAVTINACATASMAAAPVAIVGVPEAGKIVTVAPNPFADHLVMNIESDKRGQAVVSLLDVWGRQLLTKTVQLQQGNNRISLNGLRQYAAGSYYLRVSTSGATQSYKLVRQ